jgi:hypothetical protein
MNAEIKPVLILVLICTIFAFPIKMAVFEQADAKPIGSISNVVPEDTNETTESEIIEEPTTKTETTESSQVKTTENTETKKTEIKAPTAYGNYSVPKNNSIKSYMDYRRITLKSSKQYALQKSKAYTGDHGIRMVGDRYCIAVGSYYTTTIGQYIDVELANGNVIKGILADCKDDKDTDSTNRINPNGSVVEFVVDTSALDKTAKVMGDISYVNDWNSKIVNIKVYDKVEEF